MHDVLIVSVPLLTIIAGLFFNNRAISELKPEIRDVRSEIRDLRTETRQGFDKANDRFNRVDDRLTDSLQTSFVLPDDPINAERVR